MEAKRLLKINKEDKDLITDVGLGLFETMKSLTTTLWKTKSNVHKDAMNEAKKKEFSGRNAVDRANESLGAAIEAGNDGDKLENAIKKFSIRS